MAAQSSRPNKHRPPSRARQRPLPGERPPPPSRARQRPLPAPESRPRLVLASASPQRRAILRRLGVRFSVRPTRVRELRRGDPREIAVENALRKARAAGTRTERELVLACDTLVSLDGAIYGKPSGEAAARRTLRALSGRTHEVISGLALISAREQRSAIARTAVSFRELDEKLLHWYLSTGEWHGRAGAYAIQGAGAALVRGVEGDYENVVGLPVAALLDLCPRLLG
jgi:septum formation protein